MRKILFLVVAALIISTAQAKAQQPTFAQIGTPCSTSPIYGNAQWCFDGITAATHNVYYNSGTSWTILPNTGVTPSLTSLTTTGTADRTVNVTNGGHINSTLGSATIPAVSTCGTGAVTAISTDNAFQVAATGATACTVTFNVAYTAQPICTCTDNTTAAGLKLVYSTGVSVTISGLTSGDTFGCICLGH